jgi:hypothetical protein
VKHAGAAALDRLSPLLQEIRDIEALSERSRGVFYLRSRAFLHFHEDPAGLFADLRSANGDFERFQVDADAPARSIVDLVRRRVAELTAIRGPSRSP